MKLSIGELAEQTGVPVATLRSWESRHGFPVPEVLESGHRRYRPEQVNDVLDVVRLRNAGRSMTSAVAEATQASSVPARSFFSNLVKADPGLRRHVLSKRALSAVTSAVEDECVAQASRPVLFGTFQEPRFYRQSESRWKELSRTSAGTVVFAEFGHHRRAERQPNEVALESDSPVLREWVLVCDAPGFTACVAAWELPSSPGTPDGDRRFETTWTLDPGLVRRATKLGLALLRDADPDLADRLASELSDAVAPPSPDLVRATNLFARIVEYSQSAAVRQEVAS